MADLKQSLLEGESPKEAQAQRCRRVEEYPPLQVPDLLPAFQSGISTNLNLQSPITCALSCKYGFVVGLEDGRVTLLDNENNLKLIGQHESKVKCMHVSGSLLVSGSRASKEVWNLDTMQRFPTTFTGGRRAQRICISSSGEWVVALLQPNHLEVWNPQHTSPNRSDTSHLGKVKTLGMSLDGNYVIAGAADGMLLKWGTQEGMLIERQLHERQISCLAFTPDGEHVLTGSADSTVKLFNFISMTEVGCFGGHGGSVKCVLVSTYGHRAYSGSDDHTIKVWNLQSQQEIATLKGHHCEISCLALSRDEKYLLSGAKDGSVRVWSTETWAAVGTDSGHTSAVVCVAVTGDGRYAISGAKGGLIRIIGFSRSVNPQSNGSWQVADVQTTASGGANYYYRGLEDWNTESKAATDPYPTYSQPTGPVESGNENKSFNFTCFLLAVALIVLPLFVVILLV